MKYSFQTTIYACFTGYIVQAIVNNFVPLLFITFHSVYKISLEQITVLISLNFGVQLAVDLLSAKFADRIGYRTCILIAHGASAAGLIFLTILPELMDPYTGILLSVITYAIGGGIIEVLISPIMESCPTDNKESAMSLLHSFYCWGHVGVVLVSTLFFSIVGISCWKFLSLFWAVIPLLNLFVFMNTPIAPLIAEDETGMGIRELFSNPSFWILILMMICSGASEQSVSQWSSAFAEKGLGISKFFGDLAGPMTFAVLMGTARAFYGKYSEKISLDRFMIFSAVLCIFSYLLAGLFPNSFVNLFGCAICGISVGIMWPGTLSKAASSLRCGGTAMFALLALAGDIGCSCGPALVGVVSGAAGGNMKTGILAAAVFPVLLLLCLLLSHRNPKKIVE